MVSRVLVVSYHFYPDPAVGARRVSELAIWLRDRGMQVTVIAARSKPASQPDPRLAGIEVLYLKVPIKLSRWLLAMRRKSTSVATRRGDGPGNPEHAERFLDRAKRYYHSLEALFDALKLWSLIAMLRVLLLRARQSFDLVISSGPPMSSHLVARWARWLFRASWLLDLRDPWVGNEHMDDNVKSALRTYLEAYAERGSIAVARSVLCASPGIAAEVAHRYPRHRQKINVVFNGYDGAACLEPRSSDGVLRLLYAGSLYFNRSPFPLLEAIVTAIREQRIAKQKIELVMVGDCRRCNGVDLVDWGRANSATEWLKVRDPVSTGELRDMISRVDVLINFAQGQKKQVPAKTFEYIAAGREMLVVAERDSDTWRVVDESKMGRLVEPNGHDGLSDVIRDLYQFYAIDRRTFPIDRSVIERYKRVTQYEKLQPWLG